MTDASCTRCGYPIASNGHSCPNCGQAVIHNPTDDAKNMDVRSLQNISGEVGNFHEVPKLGEYLIENGIISEEELHRALDYQNNCSYQGHNPLLGQVLVDLQILDRASLNEAITAKLLSLESKLDDEDQYIDKKNIQHVQDIERRLLQTRLAGDIIQYAIAATSLSDLLDRALSLILERFQYDNAAIYLLDESDQSIALRASISNPNQVIITPKSQLSTDPQSIVSWVAANNQYIVTSNPKLDGYADDINQSHIEIGIPLAVGESVLGVIHIVAEARKRNEQDDIEILLTIANHIAALVQNFRLIENTQRNLDLTNWLYETSQQLLRSKSAEDISKITTDAIHQSYQASAYLSVARGYLEFVAICNPKTPGSVDEPGQFECSPLKLLEIKPYLSVDIPRVLDMENAASEGLEQLTSIFTQLKWNAIALIPIAVQQTVIGLIMLGETHSGSITPSQLQPFTQFAELVSNAYRSIASAEHSQKYETILDIVGTLSQAISLETDLDGLYQLIHEQVSRMMGDVDFLIALYDAPKNTIDIPYAYENNQLIKLPSFPLGEGLTSIIIETRSPLMIVEDAERQASELGAKVFGAPAKSWLGVPLIAANQVVGVIIVQDLDTEYRFEPEDQRLLSMIATPVAATIHSANLLLESNQRIDRERIVKDITTKLWSSTDVNTILRTAILELGRSLHASEGLIKLEAPFEKEHDDQPHDPSFMNELDEEVVS